MIQPDLSIHLTSAGPRRGTCPNGHDATLFDMHILTATGVSEAVLGAAVFCPTCRENEEDTE